MPRAVWTALGLGLGALALYFAFWPVPVDPVAWTPPPAPGYGGPFARNDRLAAMERLSLGADHGPEGRGAGRCGAHLHVHAGGTYPEIAPRRLGCRVVRGHERRADRAPPRR